MEYTTFGKTGRKVSRIGFGGAPAGLPNYLGDYDPDDRQQRKHVVEALERAVELGITYFDTAPSYGAGRSEEMFGEALAGVNDKDIFLATKVHLFDPKEARAEMEASLTRLRRSPVDLMQIHGGCYTGEQEHAIFRSGGLLDELERAKSEGLTRFIGFTVEQINAVTLRLIECGRFDTVQMAYNVMFQHPYDPDRENGTMYDAEEAGLGIVTMRTMTSGVFQRWMERVNPANTFDYTPAVLQFVLSNPLVDVALIGMRDAEIVERNVAICDDLAGRVDLTDVHAKYPPPD